MKKSFSLLWITLFLSLTSLQAAEEDEKTDLNEVKRDSMLEENETSQDFYTAIMEDFIVERYSTEDNRLYLTGNSNGLSYKITFRNYDFHEFYASRNEKIKSHSISIDLQKNDSDKTSNSRNLETFSVGDSKLKKLMEDKFFYPIQAVNRWQLNWGKDYKLDSAFSIQMQARFKNSSSQFKIENVSGHFDGREKISGLLNEMSTDDDVEWVSSFAPLVRFQVEIDGLILEVSPEVRNFSSKGDGLIVQKVSIRDTLINTFFVFNEQNTPDWLRFLVEKAKDSYLSKSNNAQKGCSGSFGVPSI